MRIFLVLLLSFVCSFSIAQLRDSVRVTNRVFDVVYSEKLEQPKWLVYYSINRPTNVSRSGLDFYTESGIKTSDGADYYANVWDKGHLAPAATFADSIHLMKQTFSYLNCILQHQDLNRGAWRLLEEHERQLSSTGTVKVSILMVYSASSIKLSSGATVPDGFYKYITVNGKTTIYYFKNERPATTDYKQYVVAKGPKLTIK